MDHSYRVAYRLSRPEVAMHLVPLGVPDPLGAPVDRRGGFPNRAHIGVSL
jgi:hypothetical protein